MRSDSIIVGIIKHMDLPFSTKLLSGIELLDELHVAHDNGPDQVKSEADLVYL